ncbi:hypothetical protein Aple_074210 [Acrocarpospora pleiomorpha]|uniref:Clp R domain-containing protein n=1 Tax=Acrocarpospora pleiomorpha TaxID=90975 RepID=A0A5M3XTZ9_9ACTN|nr:hypothetical protein Aple_074210 [Acrocarpospora pleiomorpha]
MVVLVKEEAQILSHNYIGTEHILLGLIRESEGKEPMAMGWSAGGCADHVAGAGPVRL